MKKNITNLIIAILFTIFFIFTGLMAALFFRPFYYHEIDRLNLEEYSGYAREEIIANYDSLIDYCSPFYKGELRFATFPASREGIIHFAEVKNIFNAIFYSGVTSAVLLLFLIYWKIKKGDTSYLFTSSIISVVLPLAAGLFCVIDFDKTFVIFHKIFFRNDYWIFSADTDPVISILPQEFFLDCALVIVGTVILGSIILLLLSLFFKRRNNDNSRK